MPIDLLEGSSPAPQGRDLLAEISTPEYESKIRSGTTNLTPDDVKRNRDQAKAVGKSFFAGILESAGGLAQKAMNSSLGAALVPAGQLAKKGGGNEVLQKAMQLMDEGQAQGVPGAAAKLAGNMAGLAPLGGPLRALGAIPKLATSTLGRTAATGLAGASQGALVGGTAYDKSNPESSLNVPGAAMGAVGGAAIGAGANALGAIGSRMRPDQLVGKAYNKLISKVSKKILMKPGSNKLSEIEKIATNEIQTVARAAKSHEKQLWQSSLLDDIGGKPVDVTPLKNSINDYIEGYAGRIKATRLNELKRLMPKSDSISFKDLKEFRTMLRANVKDGLWYDVAKKRIPMEAAEGVNTIYKTTTSLLKKAAVDNNKGDTFTAANEVSKLANMFRESTGKSLAELATKRAVAANFVNKFFTPSSAVMSKEKLALLPEGAANVMRGKLLAEHAIKNTKGGVFNMKGFIDGINSNPSLQQVMVDSPHAKMFTNLYKIVNSKIDPGILHPPGEMRQSAIFGLGTRFLNYITKPGGASLRKQLQSTGLLRKNEMMKDYMEKRVARTLIKLGVSSTNGILDIKQD